MPWLSSRPPPKWKNLCSFACPFTNVIPWRCRWRKPGADALVLTAAPRGTARDIHAGRLVSGRIYGPLIKPLVLRIVGRLRREIPDEIPIIGCGGIHSPGDARDYIDAGRHRRTSRYRDLGAAQNAGAHRA